MLAGPKIHELRINSSTSKNKRSNRKTPPESATASSKKGKTAVENLSLLV